MEAPFHSRHKKQSEKVLIKLIQNVKELDIIDIVIPCVDQSSLRSKKDMKMFVSSIKKALPLAEKYNINLNFETDLNPKKFKRLLSQFNSNRIKVNYDIGNSVSLGYNPRKEFKAYGEYISDLHIKDRLIGGTSVELGTGNADFKTVFKLLKKYKFKGNIIMQSAKDEKYIDDLKLVEKQKKFISKYIKKYLD
jgi:hexulose-6-phosphate isomerase